MDQGLDDVTIKSFDVPTSYVDELRAASVPESAAGLFPNSPIRVDVNQATDQVGLRACACDALAANIVPGSGRVGC